MSENLYMNRSDYLKLICLNKHLKKHFISWEVERKAKNKGHK
jgi:hypothetical protein